MDTSLCEDMSFGVQEQATGIGYGDYTNNTMPLPVMAPMGDLNLPVGELNLSVDSSWDDLITPQTESMLPMEHSGSQAGIEYETGTQGSQFAPGMERHAPQTLPLQGSAPYLPTMSFQPSYMPSLYGNESASIEMSGSPRAGDTFYPVVTPMTPMEEHGRYCPSPALSYQPPSVASVASVASEASSVLEDTVIEEKVPNEACYGFAVRHADALSDQDEGALLIHGRLQRYPSVLLPEAKIAKPEVQIDKGRSEQVTVTYKLPSYYQTMEEYIQKNSLEEDGGYYCMESVMRVVRKLEHLHSKLLTGHGAFSDISKIQMHVSRRSRDLVTFLIPELSKLAEAMKLKDRIPDENLVSSGMLEDIKSLGVLLRSLLPLLQNRDIHVSQKLLVSLQKAADLCFGATSRGDMAKIAQALNFKKRLCTLHVKFPPRQGMCTLDIVCYEGENIYEVLSSAWLNDGKTVEMYGFKLLYDDRKLPVGKDNEVFFPVCKVHLAPCY